MMGTYSPTSIHSLIVTRNNCNCHLWTVIALTFECILSVSPYGTEFRTCNHVRELFFYTAE